MPWGTEMGLPLKNSEYLERVKSFQSSSEKYMESHLHGQWKKNRNMFKLIHENQALMTDPRYRHRSKLYIPKARNAVMRKLAAFLSTYFSNPDVVSVKPRRKRDPVMAQAAALLHSCMNYRLKNTMNFFLNTLFAWLDIMQYGRGAVCMGWDYQEETTKRKETLPLKDEDGIPEDIIEQTVETVKVLKDEPTLRHVPLWNLFLAPTADPIDPVNSSPCLVERIPVFTYDAVKKFKGSEWNAPKDVDLEEKGKLDEFLEGYAWKPSSIEDEIYGEDKDGFTKNALWQQIEVWKCFVNVDGEDVYFLSLRGEHMLTEPERVEDKWPCRGRPYILGGIIPDSGLVYWPSFLEIVEGLQREMNAIRNQRRDNVTLALNKKLLVRRNTGIDTNSLLYSRPGAPILGDDIGEMAVRELRYEDVTSSSYKEQQINEQAFEEATGITPYNMGTQRPGMNPTATGVSILTEEANTVNAMELRIINETFMVPMLRMHAQFEQAFESEEIMRYVADEEGIDFDSVWTDEAIEGEYHIEVDAGIGATSRELRLRNLGMMLDRAMAINTQYGAPVMNLIQFARDAMPLAGFENPDKYVNENVLKMVMSKFGQVAGMNLMDPTQGPARLISPANSGGSQVESMQGYGGDKQIYR